MTKVTRSGTSAAQLDRIDAAARTILVDVGSYLADKMEKKLADKNKNATGALTKSIVVTVPQKSLYGWSTKIGPTAKEAKYVVFGRRPGAKMPPVQAIENWLLVRGLQASMKSNGSRTVEQQIRSAAWAIAKSISINGIDPFPFVSDAYKENKQQIKSMLKERMRLAIKQIKSSPRKADSY